MQFHITPLRCLTLFAPLWGASNLAAAAPQVVSSVVLPKVIRIGADFRSMPWYGTDEKTGVHKGFEYELAQKMFAAIDPSIKLEFVSIPWDRIENAVDEKKVDIGFNGFFLPPEADRKNGKYTWSQCYFNTSLATLYLKKNGAPQSLADLKKKSVTVFNDPAAIAAMKAAGIRNFKKNSFDFKFVEFVETGKTDFAIIDTVGAQYMAAQTSQKVGVELTLLKTYSEGCYAVFGTRDKQPIIDAFNKLGIPELQKHKKTILEKYGLIE